MKKCTFCGRKYSIIELTKDESTCKICGGELIDIDENKAYDEEVHDSIYLKYRDYFNDDALLKILYAYETGHVKENVTGESEEICRILAFRGNLDGMYKYANYCINSNPPDYETAVKWLRLAAKRGHEPSKIMLEMLNKKVDSASLDTPLEMKEATDSLEIAVKNVLPAIVTICARIKQKGNVVNTSNGSGFIIDGGYIVTNHHVAGPTAKAVTAQFDPSITKEEFMLEFVAYEKDYDISILRFVDDLTASNYYKTVRLSNVEPIFGQKVYTIGNPLSRGISVSQGVISSPRRKESYPSDKVEYVIHTDISFNHGNSGGGLFNMNNEVLGIATFYPSRARAAMGMCVPAKYITEVLNRAK